MEYEIIELAPWVAIAMTLILSILVPVFTQIANNRFQIKKAKQDRIFNEVKEKHTRKTEAYERFLMDTGGAIQQSNSENLSAAGASIGRLYLYVPSEWYSKLDDLYRSVRHYNWGDAEKQFEELAKLLSEEYGSIDEKRFQKK